MEDLELENQPKNKFYEVINDHYGKLFQEVYDSDPYTRDEKMKNLYESSKTDDSLSDDKKKLISLCMLAYNNAICEENMCGLLIFFTQHKQINIKKLLKIKKLSRLIDDLYTTLNRIKFPFRPELVSELVQAVLATYGKGSKNKEITNMDIYPLIVLASYARGLSPVDYKDMWFCAMFMKNLSSIAYVSEKVLDDHPEIKKQRENLYKFFMYLNSKYQEEKSFDPSTSL